LEDIDLNVRNLPVQFLNQLVQPAERQTAVQLQDGRKLVWSEWGPIDGIPVLFCTGAGMNGSLGFGASHLPALGLRLMAIDRPGLGLSDPHLSKTLSSWVDDVRELIHGNQLHPVLAVGFSQGAPFAFALAGAGLVEAIAIVSGQDELTHPSIKPLLHPDVAAMIAAVEQDAAAFEQHFSETATWEGLWQLIITMSAECDRALYLSDSFSQAYQGCLREGFSQGARGYARDLVNAMSAWSLALEDIPIPVDLWYGGLDTSPVHSPDFGATLASRLPQVSHILAPNEGGSILWTRSHDILSKLKSHVLAMNSNIVDVVAWICIRDRQVLCARTTGKDVFYLPGGKREKGESDWEALRREVQEELNVSLIPETLIEVIVVQEVAHGYAQPTQVTMRCFQANYTGEIIANSEIEAIAWLNHIDLDRCAPATQRVLEYLYQQQWID
jgi:pimeloyl-ACP methyl ester carboxylesterase/ADP-ribose pyrophosphatase YjhB (NUDIX family)